MIRHHESLMKMGFKPTSHLGQSDNDIRLSAQQNPNPKEQGLLFSHIKLHSVRSHCETAVEGVGKSLKMAGGEKGIVIVFDFDRTLIDDDADRWVVAEMGLTHLFNQLRLTLPWNTLMDRMVEELHVRGKTAEDIAKCLKQVPIHTRTIAAIKSAHDLGCDLKVLSDANQFYIETILKHHGLYDCFSEIITNPTVVDGEGRLRILPYHDLTSFHGCDLCPPNLCKGLVITRIQSSLAEDRETRFIYLGDGRGDFCPSLKLDERDHVMPRNNFPLWDLISNNRSLMKAQVHEWINGEELERILLQLIDMISLRGQKQNTPIN